MLTSHWFHYCNMKVMGSMPRLYEREYTQHRQTSRCGNVLKAKCVSVNITVDTPSFQDISFHRTKR